ncbi:MAG TPA: aspartate kinase [Anaerolineaceae bacterium]|nr:aspartate kinase [Anaerolineaceae bacterium]
MKEKEQVNSSKGHGRTLVMKFGGTSVGSSSAIRQAAQIVHAEQPHWQNLVVVVSAMSGVTDSLIACARESVTGSEQTCQEMIADLQYNHGMVLNDLLLGSADRNVAQQEIKELFAMLRSLCSGIHIMGELTPRGLDAVASLGERINARLFSAVLEQEGISSQEVDATDLIVTDDGFQHACPLMGETRSRTLEVMQPLLEQHRVAVVTGFIGATQDGVITTLGRGGSDYTAAILGDCLNADAVWTWTDVDGVMTADPRIVPDARVIPFLSYNEVSEMAYFGAKVLHPKTIRPVVERGIPLWVKNTFNPSHPGTCINGNAPSHDGRITAITAIRGLSLITVEGRGMIGVPGIAARTFSAVARHDASVLMISQSSSEQSICFVIPSEVEKEVVHAIEDEMALELTRHDIDRVWAQPNVVIVTAIGSGMRNTPGVSARLFGALGKENINVIAIAQGSSEYSISVVVDVTDADQAVQQIHQEVIINGSSK